MTREEYQDFVLRYKGCGACFPMYHTLSRFEKMWFTAIQKDIATLEKENTELKSGCGMCYRKDKEQLTKAKEIIKELMSFSVQLCDCKHTVDFEKTREEAEQFLSEVE